MLEDSRAIPVGTAAVDRSGTTRTSTARRRRAATPIGPSAAPAMRTPNRPTPPPAMLQDSRAIPAGTAAVDRSGTTRTSTARRRRAATPIGPSAAPAKRTPNRPTLPPAMLQDSRAILAGAAAADHIGTTTRIAGTATMRGNSNEASGSAGGSDAKRTNIGDGQASGRQTNIAGTVADRPSNDRLAPSRSGASNRGDRERQRLSRFNDLGGIGPRLEPGLRSNQGNNT